MDISLKSKVAEIFTKYNFSKDDALFSSDVLGEIDHRQDKKFEVSKELFLTQKDKVELVEKIKDVEVNLIEKIKDVEVNLNEKITNLHKSIYIVGLVQFLAIVGSILVILSFMLK